MSFLCCLKVKELVKRVECSLGPVDVLINSAGVMHYNFMKNVSEDQWEREIDINCKVSLSKVSKCNSEYFLL